jgi:hypothetical protein
MTTTIKTLLEAEKRLASLITELEPHKDEMPAGAFRHLTTAENLMQNRRANLEKKNDRSDNR